MTQTQMDKLIRAAEQRYLQRITAAKEARDKEVESIKVVFHISTEQIDPPDFLPTEGDAHRNRFDLSQHVKSALTEIELVFTTSDLEGLLRNRHPELNGDVNRKGVWSALQRLLEEKIITVEASGKGRRPTTYRKVTEAGQQAVA